MKTPEQLANEYYFLVKIFLASNAYKSVHWWYNDFDSCIHLNYWLAINTFCRKHTQIEPYFYPHLVAYIKKSLSHSETWFHDGLNIKLQRHEEFRIRYEAIQLEKTKLPQTGVVPKIHLHEHLYHLPEQEKILIELLLRNKNQAEIEKYMRISSANFRTLKSRAIKRLRRELAA